MKKGIIKIVISFMAFTIFFTTQICAYNVQEELGTTDLSSYAELQAGSKKFNKKVNTALGVISTAGSLIAVIVLICIGVRYMAGSVEEKFELKKTLKPYLIGALMVFGIPNLLNVIYLVAGNLFVY